MRNILQTGEWKLCRVILYKGSTNTSLQLIFLQLLTMTRAEGLYPTLVTNCIFNVSLFYAAIALNIITIQALRKTSSLPRTLKTLLLSLALLISVLVYLSTLYLLHISLFKYNETLAIMLMIQYLPFSKPTWLYFLLHRFLVLSL